VTYRPIDPIDSRSKFAQLLSPCLILTAPSGMGEGEREAWLHAAWAALKHLPSDLIEAGAKVAMAKADHPSKIVPAILAEVADVFDRRRKSAAMDRPTALPAPRETAEEKAEREEVAKLMDGLVRKLSANA
jgi:hypothetical protein